MPQPSQIKTRVEKATREAVELERSSDDFSIRVAVDFSKKPVPLSSGLSFVDKILSGISTFSVAVEMPQQAADEERLIKNAGFAFGEAVRKLYDKRKARETAALIKSEGKAMCMLAIGAKRQPGEANLQIIGTPERGFEPDRFFIFFDGFAQGMEAELNLTVNLAGGKTQLGMITRTFSEALKRILG